MLTEIVGAIGIEFCNFYHGLKEVSVSRQII